MENKKGNIKLSGLIIIILSIAILSVGGVIGYNLLSKPKDNVIDNNQEKNDKKEEEIQVPPVEEKKPIKIINLDSKTRPYAVMINCHHQALPQSGLQDAYIVYEIMVEYGITRMMALFKDAPMSKVGSIRSLRNQYIGYAFENDAIIVHAGGSAEADGRLANEGINHVDVDGIYGVRDTALRKVRAYEHTLFTNSTLLAKGVSDKKIRNTTEQKPLLNYSVDEVDLSKYQTKPVSKMSIKYSNYRTSQYNYDETKKVYHRSMNGVKNVDLVTGKQYEVKNIIAYGVKYTTYTDHGYYGYQRISNIGTGEGYYITNGVALPITWSKADEKSQTIYKIKETGEDLVVNDGNTYIQIYPSNGGTLTIS